MSHSSRRHSSQESSRRSSSFAAQPIDALAYSSLALAGPNPPETPLSSASFDQSPQEPFPVHGYPPLEPPPPYLASAYSPPGVQKPETSPDVVHFYEGSIKLFPRDAPDGNMMMAQRDMGFVSLGPWTVNHGTDASRYGYMPGPMSNPLQYGPGGPSYSSLAPLPGYYAEPQPPQQTQQQQQQHHQHHRSYSGSSRPASSLPVVDYQSLGGDPGDDAASRKRRRTSQHEARRQNKLRVRRNNHQSLPSLGADQGTMGNSGSGQLTEAPVDLYSAAASTPTTYVPDHRPAMPSPFRHDYGDASSGYGYGLTSPVEDAADRVARHPSYGSPQYHQPSYSMGPLSGGSLAPPLLPGANSYSPGRSSPLLQAPLPPAAHGMAHPEPIHMGGNAPPTAGGREKPQCWDHGCNGREFSTFSNLLRHQREKSGSAAKSYCPHCGAEFTRTTARNGHVEHGKCKNRKASDASNPGNP